MKKLIALIVLAPCCAFGASMSTYPAKTTPVSADKLLISDSAASDATKNVTIGSIWENLPGTTFSATNLGWTSQSALETWLGWSFSGGASSLSQLSDWPSAVSATEVGYLDGVTSNIQTQINALTAASFSPTIQASTPSNSAATGPYINSSNNHFLYNISATGYYDLTAATYTAHTFDTTPSAFSFTDVADATLSTQYTALAQINGIDTGITCTGSGGTVAACTGSTEGTCGAFGSTSGSITNNQYVGARVTSSGSNATAVNNIVTCGGVSDTYTVTTVAGASNPEFVQAKATYSKTNSITLDSPVTGGNQLIAVMLSTASIPATISGGCATSWSSAVDLIPPSGLMRARMYFCSNASSGSNAVTPSGWSTGDAGWHLMEVSNVGSYDTGQKDNYSASTIFNSGNATASVATSLLVGAWQGSTTAAETWDSPWVSRSQLTGHRSAVATRVVTSTGDYNASGTVATANLGSAFIMIFKKTGL